MWWLVDGKRDVSYGRMTISYATRRLSCFHMGFSPIVACIRMSLSTINCMDDLERIANHEKGSLLNFH